MSSLHVSAQCLHARVPTWACETAVCVTIEAAARASAENRRLPLDVVLVLDRSSSMSGAKIELCKATVSFVLDEMRLCDRIALVSYGSDVRDEFGGLVAVAPDARRRCKGVVAQLRPGKRTNLSGGVLEGLEILRSAAARSEPAEGEPSRRSASLLLLTDGHANHGVVDTDKVLALVRSQLSDWSFSSLGAGGGSGGSSEGVRIFTFGYGVDHNARLLRALSDESGGLYYYVPSIDAVPVAFGDCLGGLLTVVAQNLRLRVAVRRGVPARVARVALPAALWDGVATATVDADATTGERTIRVGDMIEGQRVDVIVVVALDAAPAAAAAGTSGGAGGGASGGAAELPTIDVEVRYADALHARMATGGAVAVLHRRAASPAASPPLPASASAAAPADSGVAAFASRMPLTSDDAAERGFGAVNASVRRQVGRVVAANAMDRARMLADGGELDDACTTLAAAAREVERVLRAPALASSEQAAPLLESVPATAAPTAATFLSGLTRDLAACAEGLESVGRFTHGGGRGRILSLSQSHWRQRSNSCALMMPQGGEEYRNGTQRRMSRRASFRAVALRSDMAAADALSGGGARRMTRRRNSFSMGPRGGLGLNRSGSLQGGAARSMIDSIREACAAAAKEHGERRESSKHGEDDEQGSTKRSDSK